jgi:hypothetical protein
MPSTSAKRANKAPLVSIRFTSGQASLSTLSQSIIDRHAVLVKLNAPFRSYSLSFINDPMILRTCSAL